MAGAKDEDAGGTEQISRNCVDSVNQAHIGKSANGIRSPQERHPVPQEGLSCGVDSPEQE